MAEELVFYTNPMSRGRIVRWMLEEVGVPYRTEIVDYGPAMKTPEYLAINPMGKVPAIRYGDVVVTETPAICAWLADTFPEAGLAPPPGQRGAYYRWLFFGAGPVDAAVSDFALGHAPPADKAAMVGYGSYDVMVDTLEKAVSGGGYIAGDRFTAADVYVGAQIGWGVQMNFLPQRPAFAAYWARVSDREAYRRATALDDAAMPADST
ncbi:MAG: glutathione S-transferase [Alphaproteobacteria bacterium]|jgi:glutathione S-transferase|nr:glutathione S-transferase [Alphaproteobacteria bacterium]